ncbi:LysR family transcriptional regulator [Paraburkholderia sabiae]|jgi:DNA-binding transcriptional LysR family regulator|uniref:LysR family transcriptional regulator n=1 Tax=Paraburkholderia sabiae TaxID=273251 RepID=A0ABU9QCE1_9BURK|nr:LysR family transcriptional regulator [Paraburkholderia sabiae]WJZ72656.1 LysR family transcriptional regulator [Paraburkholderia sabiae]CAD6558500.1 PCP degradation transcriptional activation protein [Paraburkholderia sabiae]CAG9201752.1 Transcriptional regulator, LysR family [Paraburkholderia sabiae]
MRPPKLDLNLFVVFEAIYDKRNLTRAAEMLFITQPAVSNALARMRKAFDDPLFVSTPTGMVPTPLSENIIGRVREALQLLETSATEGDVFVPAASERTFRLSMPDLTEAILLPALGEVLQQQAPGMRIESYFTPRNEVPAALATGKIDFAIDVPLIDDPQLHQLPLGSDRYACMLRHDHPFAGDTLTMDDYLALGHIQVSSRRQGSGLVDAELHRLGKRRQMQMRVQHYMVAPLIALRTDLALTAPVQLLQRYDARILELPFPLAKLEWHLYWHRSGEQDQANRWVRGEVIRLMQEMGAQRK